MKAIAQKIAISTAVLFCSATLWAADFSSTHVVAQSGSAQHIFSASTAFRQHARSDSYSGLPLIPDFQLVGGSFTNTNTYSLNLLNASLGLSVPQDSSGYFTAIEFAIQDDLTLSGQWSRYQVSFSDAHRDNKFFKALDTSLLEEARNTTSRVVGLNWNMSKGWRAYAKVQTVAGSVWLPQVTIPRFVTQDSEHWTLAAIEVVYTF
ncbi:hypothetical protein ISG33_16380 [Glaciecola sp. MH2013]|uniref:hypothetical protein n=1 Tax=Glaciecola sp. MH2013 TaxID=2785524 RepID=UPI00189D8D22|nr:hypothetical protein [Glaciecola sp. MH2013]MBF7074979.1 hypothetical protein [Glaciecola sp. MH2013]